MWARHCCFPPTYAGCGPMSTGLSAWSRRCARAALFLAARSRCWYCVNPSAACSGQPLGWRPSGLYSFRSGERIGMTTEQPYHARRWRAVAAASIGNAFEWFDFIIYGFFAVMIARLFFPAGNEAAALLLSFASFGVTFVMRPLGAVVLGEIADRHGRKVVLTLTISMMMTGIAITAFAPTYASIGIIAPIMIVGARMIQGFSAGGEFGSATVFLAEQHPTRRGFYASWQFAGQGLSTALATGFGAVLNVASTAEQLSAWGWRIPFVFG